MGLAYKRKRWKFVVSGIGKDSMFRFLFQDMVGRYTGAFPEETDLSVPAQNDWMESRTPKEGGYTFPLQKSDDCK